MRPGGNYTPATSGQRSEARLGSNNVVLDGTLGFDDPMEMDAGYGNQKSSNGGGLYSDTIVKNGTNGASNGGGGGRRGRGFNNRAGYGGGR